MKIIYLQHEVTKKFCIFGGVCECFFHRLPLSGSLKDDNATLKQTTKREKSKPF